MTALPLIAVVGAGGTISSLATHDRDYMNYPETGRKLSVDEVIAEVPQLADYAEIVPLSFRSVGSSAFGPDDWLRLHRTISVALTERPQIAGVVIFHGTATIEETAWFLDLTLAGDRPVVLVGAQRPLNTVSTDAPLNAINAMRIAADPESVGRGSLVVLNDEIHAARDVTKGSTFRLHAFHSGIRGAVGVADPDRVVFHRPAEAMRKTRPVFDVSGRDSLPRVDICYAYAGSDGTAARAFLAAGARGLVSAGFAPGMPATLEREVLVEAARLGVPIVQASRAAQGRVARRGWLQHNGWIAAGDLTPQKARILLMLGLLESSYAERLQDLFDSH